MRNEGDMAKVKEQGDLHWPTLKKWGHPRIAWKQCKVILKKLLELQENKDGKLDKIKKMIHGQNKTMNKDTKNRNKTKQILESKNTINGLKQSIREFQQPTWQNRRDQWFKDKSFDIIR